jgi:hypothetical protein
MNLMIFDPYVLAAIATCVLMLALVFFAHRTQRLVLALFFVLIAAALLWLVLPLGPEGFQVGGFLLFPFCLAFCGLAVAFRARGILKVALLTFASALSVAVLVLDTFFLFGQLLDPRIVFTSESFAKYTFLIAESLILLVSLGLALLVALGLWISRFFSKRER